jgi:hypothetical protein
MRCIESKSELVRTDDMSETRIYVYKACQIIIQSNAERLWIYVVILEDEHYEPFPARVFDCEEEAVKAATQFCDNRFENVTPIDGFHRRKNVPADDSHSRDFSTK